MFEELLTPPPRTLPVACFRQLRRPFLPLAVVGTIFLIAAIGSEVAFFVQHRAAQTLAREGVPAEGALVDKLAGRFVLRLTVAYRTRDRKLHTLRQWVRANPANRWVLLGDRVRVYYDPAEPDHAVFEDLAMPQGSLARSLPIVLSAALAVLAGLSLLIFAAKSVRTARRLLQQGALVPARLIRPPRWKNLWFAQIEFAHGERMRRARSFIPPGWRAAAMPGEGSRATPAALAAPVRPRDALLLIEPSPDDW